MGQGGAAVLGFHCGSGPPRQVMAVVVVTHPSAFRAALRLEGGVPSAAGAWASLRGSGSRQR